MSFPDMLVRKLSAGRACPTCFWPTHAAFPEGSVNAFVCLLKTHETNEAVRIADLGQSIMVYVRAILALDEMPDNGK